jgi:predicted Zn-dependent peptidase
MPEKFALTVDLIMKECKKMLYEGITDEEFNDTKAFMKGNLALSLESNEVKMSQLARNEMTYGRYFDFNDIVKIIDNISIDDYIRVCDKIFKNKTFSLVSVGKLKKKIKIENLNLSI